MTVRLRYTIQVGVSSTTAEENDLGNPKYEVVTDIEGKGGTWKTTVPTMTTDVLLAMGNITTAQFVVIRTSPNDPNDPAITVSIKKNSTGGEATPIVPVGDSVEGIYVISTDSLTALYATNASAYDVDLTVTVVGDSTA